MKIELKERTEHHVRVYFSKTQDLEIQAMLPSAVTTLEQALNNYQKTFMPGATSYGRTIYVDDNYVGDIWCYCIDMNSEPNAMLSYCLFEKNYWNCGVMSYATSLFLREIRANFGVRSVGAFCYSVNAASIRVLEKNEFVEIEAFTENGKESKFLELEITDCHTSLRTGSQ